MYRSADIRRELFAQRLKILPGDHAHGTDFGLFNILRKLKKQGKAYAELRCLGSGGYGIQRFYMCPAFYYKLAAYHLAAFYIKA